MSRLVGIESLERRDVVGEWMVGLAGVGLAAMGPAPGWENPRTGYGDGATAQFGSPVDRGLASIAPTDTGATPPVSQDTSGSPPSSSSQTAGSQTAGFQTATSTDDGILPLQLGSNLGDDLAPLEAWSKAGLAASAGNGQSASQGSDGAISPLTLALPSASQGAAASPGPATIQGSAGAGAAGTTGGLPAGAKNGTGAHPAVAQPAQAQPAAQPAAASSAVAAQSSAPSTVSTAPVAGSVTGPSTALGAVWNGPYAQAAALPAAVLRPAGAPAANSVGNATSGSDPTWVVDWNSGLTLSPNAVDYVHDSDSMDLRAQTQAATVTSYSWNFSGAPSASNVSGTSTSRVQFTWSPVYNGTYISNTVQLTVNTTTGQHVFNYTFWVVHNPNYNGGGSGGSGGSGGGGTPVSVTRQEVITPDLLGENQPAIDGDGYSISTVTGDLNTSYTLPSYNPTAPAIGLSYNSESADPQPIFLDHYQLNSALGSPSEVSAQLTFNGTAGAAYYYSTADVSPGSILQIALQATNAQTLPTGRYPWQISVTAYYTGNNVTTSNSGSVSVDRIIRPARLGAGWEVQGVSQLYPQTGGAILDLGDGQSLWFAWNQGTQTYTTPAGDFSTLTLNSNGTYTRKLETGVQVNFNSSGQETSVVDLNGNTLSYAYSNGALTSITDQDGLVTNFAYTNGLLSSITDPASRTFTFSHNASAQLTGITQPNNAAWAFGYDSSGHMTSRTDTRNNVVQFNYSFAGRINGVRRADSSSDSLTPEETQALLAPGTGTQSNPVEAVLLAAAVSTYTDGRGNQWETYYDWGGFGADTGDVDPDGYLDVTHVDANGLTIETTDQDSRNTAYVRDSMGNILSTTNPDFTTSSDTYNSFCEVLQSTAANGYTTQYSYDSKGNLIQETDPLGDVQKYTYTAHGLVATATDPLGNVTTYVYDSRDRLITVTYADTGVAHYAYDTAGDMTSDTDPMGNVTQVSYNVMGLATAMLPPGLPSGNPGYVYSYDARGNMTAETDPAGDTTAMTYDALGRVTSVTDPLLKTTSCTYDAEGNLLTTTDPLNRVTQESYNAEGELISTTDPLGHTTTQTVNPVGQVTAVTDPLGDKTTTGYNVRGWVSQVTKPAGEIIYSGYDAIGDLTAGMQSGGGTTTYNYDALGRVIATIDPLNNKSTEAYDKDGNVISRTDPLNKTTTYTYDPCNRLWTQTDPLGHTLTDTYDLNGNLLTSSDGLGRVTHYQYDAQNRLIKTTDPEGNVTQQSYDLAGRLASVTDADGNVTRYAYDADSRLVTETDPVGHATTYAYDADSEVVGITDRDGRQTSYTYNAAGQETAGELAEFLGRFDLHDHLCLRQCLATDECLRSRCDLRFHV